MQNGKTVVIQEVLKQDKTFTNAEMVRNTALSRQLVWSHLKTLVEEGCLEKYEDIYLVTNRARLMDLLIDSTTSQARGARLFKPPFTSTEDVNQIKLWSDLLLAAKRLRIAGSDLAKPLYSEALEIQLQAWRQEKAYFNTHLITSDTSARKTFANNFYDLGVDFGKAAKELSRIYKHIGLEDPPDEGEILEDLLKKAREE